MVAVLLTGCIAMVQFPAKPKTFLFTTKTKPVWGLTSSPMQRDTSPMQSRGSINMTTHLSLVIIIIIIIIIIFIQLQLGWNPVAEVYNTYTANV